MCTTNFKNFHFWIQTSNLAYFFEKPTYITGKRSRVFFRFRRKFGTLCKIFFIQLSIFKVEVTIVMWWKKSIIIRVFNCRSLPFNFKVTPFKLYCGPEDIKS